MTLCVKALATSQTPDCWTVSGPRLLCLFEMVDWGFDVSPSLHFQPFWLQQRTRKISILGHELPDPTFDGSLSSWTQAHGTDTPPIATSHLQRVRDAPGIAHDKQNFTLAAVSNEDIARLMAVTSKSGSD